MNYLDGPSVVTRTFVSGIQEGLVQRMRCDNGGRGETRERFEGATLGALKWRKGP